jgi:hypothetical protein
MKPRNLVDIIERSQTRHALREERALNNFHAVIEGAVAPLRPDRSGGTGKNKFATEKVRVFTDLGWDASFWFAVLSPVFGLLAGFLAVFLIYH